MNSSEHRNSNELHSDDLRQQGFVFVVGADVNLALGNILGTPAWIRFANSWNHLPTDNYLAEHGTYRRRRHAVYSMSNSGEVRREEHQPHYQSKAYNTLQGGIER